MHIQPFRAVFPNLDLIPSVDSFFGTVKEDYPDYAANGFFNRSARASIYIYRIEHPDREHTGLLACSDIRDYIDGHICRHEATLPQKEQKQLQLLLRRHATVKPILLAYRAVPAIDKIIAQHWTGGPPFFKIHFPESQETHRIWELYRPEIIDRIRVLFAQEVAQAYIADGHHRCAALARLYQSRQPTPDGRKYRSILSAYFPLSDLQIHDYNRLLKLESAMSPVHLMADLSTLCHIEPLEGPQRPARKHEMLLLLEREWYRLRWKDHLIQERETEGPLLDTALLNELVFKGLLSIEDPRTDQRIQYIEGPKGISALTKKAEQLNDAMAFCLHPVNMADFITLSDLDQTLPPKSTFFEPRMKNGIIVQEF